VRWAVERNEVHVGEVTIGMVFWRKPSELLAQAAIG
jgi:hypothetical protein